jgi:hypothetical protein
VLHLEKGRKPIEKEKPKNRGSNAERKAIGKDGPGTREDGKSHYLFKNCIVQKDTPDRGYAYWRDELIAAAAQYWSTVPTYARRLDWKHGIYTTQHILVAVCSSKDPCGRCPDRFMEKKAVSRKRLDMS